MAETLRPAVYIPSLDAEELPAADAREPAPPDPAGRRRPDRQRLDRRLGRAHPRALRGGRGARDEAEPRVRPGDQPRRPRTPGRPGDPPQQRHRVRAGPDRGDARRPGATAPSRSPGSSSRNATPSRIDSAGVVADTTLMGFDHLHGEPVASAASAPDPLGPTGGAALYSKAAFDAVGGFDERIFLYYEDLDLALRMAAAGRSLPPRSRRPRDPRLLGEPRRRSPAASTRGPGGPAATCCAATG